MSNQTRSSLISIDFVGLLTILFIGLKLTHYIDWSWWWVLSPLWIPFAAAIAVMALIAMFLGVVVFTDKIIEKHKENAAKNKAKAAAIILLLPLLTATTYGQDYAAKVQDYFNRRSVLSGVTAPYVHAWDDYEGWSGFQDSLPVIYTIDSEGIERMADWAGRVAAWRVEEFAFGNTLWRSSNYQPVIRQAAEFDTLINTPTNGAARKVVIVGHSLINTIKGKPGYQTPESMPPDHHYTSKSQYFGFLSARIGSFSSLGLSWAGSDYNAVSMDMGAVQFELNVKSAYFQGGAFFVLDYECFVRPVGDVKYYAAGGVRR